MPTNTTCPDFYTSTASYAVETYQFEENCRVEFRTDEEELEPRFYVMK